MSRATSDPLQVGEDESGQVLAQGPRVEEWLQEAKARNDVVDVQRLETLPA
jgi:hypothetical protein